MARNRNTTPQEEITVSTTEFAFEGMTEDEFNAAGAAGVERGEYPSLLEAFAASGLRHARIPTDRGRYNGRKAATLSQSLKTAKKAEKAPDSIKNIKVTSKQNVVYLLNESVEA